MLAAGAVHPDAGWGDHVHADLRGIVDPDLVLNDLGLETGLAKLLRYELGRLLVLGRAGNVRRRGEHAHVLLGDFGIGDGEEKLLDIILSEGRGTSPSPDREQNSTKACQDETLHPFSI